MPTLPEALRRVLASPKFAASLTLIILATAFSTHLLRSVMGWAGLIGILGGLVVLAIFSLVARRPIVEWHGLLPISIIVFVAWCALSGLWSGYVSDTIIGVSYQITVGFLAIYVALVRDTFQVVRATGDVLRMLLGLSIVLEVLSGLLLDLPIAFLGVVGDIDRLGPIQGIFGSRNVFGLIALIAAVTFYVELRARSIPRGLGIGSMWLAGICLVLTRSPVIVVVALCVTVAALALYRLRRTAVDGRRMLQLGLLSAALVAAGAAWLGRTAIISALNAGSEFEARYSLWTEMWRLVELHPLEGWGWAGFWPQDVTPYGWLEFTTGRVHVTGLNAYLDVYFQVGLIGFLAFLALVLLAFVRSWLLASNKRSLAYVWAPLILVTLLVTSAAESTILFEFGWLLLVICAVKAAQGLSWRSALPHKPHPDAP
ncbi:MULTISPECIES: O-antigen ligase [unclassified Cryobacterium]|uniref:O-antigen ligase family protein n=1 Tax=unclassified Cryobacterium TaxID=2649013 RepID=UPI00106D7205|nr:MULTISPECIES: O-antigen ligase family protein [unclassified Cryobacterium]TFD09616.1 exopolysaccharide production protein [Cryobacterium sp. TMT1-2-2]TFD10264.1 exopolysaccharide production protein [Cryobacterium sp. TMT1-66-1]